MSHRKPALSLGAALLIASGLSLFPIAAAQKPADVPSATAAVPAPSGGLLLPAAGAPTRDPAAGDGVRRGRAVSIGWQALQGRRAGDILSLDLFDDARFLARLDQVQERPLTDSISYSGTLLGESGGLFWLVAHKGALVGSIELPDGRSFRINPLEETLHCVQQIDNAALGLCGGEEPPPFNDATNRLLDARSANPNPAGANGPVAAGGNGPVSPVIDVMVVYTPQAEAKAGGQAAIEARAQLAVDKTNTTYQNSQINASVHLVHILKETYYTEPASSSSSFQTMLSAITNSSDGQMDDILTARGEYGADMVSLLVSDGSLCGLAWVMTSLSTGFAGNAYSVVNVDCAVNGYAFPHELGHNQGCHHEQAHTGTGLYPYSKGWVFKDTTGSTRTTVMYYAPSSSIPYFSNPDVLYNGTPTGVAPGQTDQADNALTINNSAPTAALWAFSMSPPELVPAGVTLTAEGCDAPNGVVDPGETVSLDLALKNISSGSASNLVATLQASGGITPITTTQTYGMVQSGGAAVSRPFQLIANGTCGGTATVTLGLEDSGRSLGTVSFPLHLGGLGDAIAQTFTAGGGPTPIPDAATMVQSLDIPFDGAVDDVNVGVRLDHTWDGDIVLTLIAPDGTEVALTNANGSSGDNYGTGPGTCDDAFTVFDDSADTAITSGTAPFTGRYRPQQPLSALNGKPCKGTWKLRVTDRMARDTGTLYCWNIALTRKPYACCGVAAYTMPDAARALSLAAGLANPGNPTLPLDIVTTGDSAGRIDIADALAIARKAIGWDPNP